MDSVEERPYLTAESGDPACEDRRNLRDQRMYANTRLMASAPDLLEIAVWVENAPIAMSAEFREVLRPS